MYEDKGISPSFADEIATVVEEGCDFACSMNKYGCFTANTLIETANGKIPIENINTNDQVYSFNHETYKKELKMVTTIKKYLVSALVVLGLSNGDTLTATPSHPFYHQGAYVEAQHLAVGDTLTAFNSTRPVWITYHESKQLRDTVYNFTVADNHNYYVGSDGVLVHNDCFLQTLEDKYPVVARKLDELDAPAKKAFQKQFANQGDEVLAKFNQGDGELVKAWDILIINGKKDLKTHIPSLEALNKIRKNTKLSSFGITDNMLGRIQGIGNPDIPYSQVLNDLDEALKVLPEGKTKDFVKVIQSGENRGLVNPGKKVGMYDRRHSWLTLKKIKENQTFLKNADEMMRSSLK